MTEARFINRDPGSMISHEEEEVLLGLAEVNHQKSCAVIQWYTEKIEKVPYEIHPEMYTGSRFERVPLSLCTASELCDPTAYNGIEYELKVTYENKFCIGCYQEPLYDQKNNKYYCPTCE